MPPASRLSGADSVNYVGSPNHGQNRQVIMDATMCRLTNILTTLGCNLAMGINTYLIRCTSVNTATNMSFTSKLRECRTGALLGNLSFASTCPSSIFPWPSQNSPDAICRRRKRGGAHFGDAVSRQRPLSSVLQVTAQLCHLCGWLGWVVRSPSRR
jgi:hypothetical protein